MLRDLGKTRDGEVDGEAQKLSMARCAVFCVQEACVLQGPVDPDPAPRGFGESTDDCCLLRGETGG